MVVLNAPKFHEDGGNANMVNEIKTRIYDIFPTNELFENYLNVFPS